MKVGIASWHASLCTPATYQGQVDLKYPWEERTITRQATVTQPTIYIVIIGRFGSPNIFQFSFSEPQRQTPDFIGIGSATKVESSQNHLAKHPPACKVLLFGSVMGTQIIYLHNKLKRERAREIFSKLQMQMVIYTCAPVKGQEVETLAFSTFLYLIILIIQ